MCINAYTSEQNNHISLVRYGNNARKWCLSNISLSSSLPSVVAAAAVARVHSSTRFDTIYFNRFEGLSYFMYMRFVLFLLKTKIIIIPNQMSFTLSTLANIAPAAGTSYV